MGVEKNLRHRRNGGIINNHKRKKGAPVNFNILRKSLFVVVVILISLCDLTAFAVNMDKIKDMEQRIKHIKGLIEDGDIESAKVECQDYEDKYANPPNICIQNKKLFESVNQEEPYQSKYTKNNSIEVSKAGSNKGNIKAYFPFRKFLDKVGVMRPPAGVGNDKNFVISNGPPQIDGNVMEVGEVRFIDTNGNYWLDKNIEPAMAIFVYKYEVIDGSIYEIQRIGPTRDKVSTSKCLVIPSSMKVGSQWECSRERTSYKYSYEGNEPVETSAGRFGDCIKIKEVLSPNPFIETYDLKDQYNMNYYCRDIGLAKSVTVSISADDKRDTMTMYDLTKIDY